MVVVVVVVEEVPVVFFRLDCGRRSSSSVFGSALALAPVAEEVEEEEGEAEPVAPAAPPECSLFFPALGPDA